jgi:hypothetical protein
MNPDCHPVEQLQRQQFLEELYVADGRMDPAHPRYGLFTGLMQAHRAKLRDQQIHELLTAWWTDSYGRPPGTHAVMTHVAFAQHVLENVK